MSGSVRVPVYAGATKRVALTRAEAPRAEARAVLGVRRRRPLIRRARFCETRTQLVDPSALLVRHLDASGPYDSFEAQHLETTPNPSQDELDHIARIITESIDSGPAVYVGGRTEPTRAYPWQDADATTGYLAGLTFRAPADGDMAEYSRHFEIVHGAEHWQGKLSPAERYSEWQRVRPFIDPERSTASLARSDAALSNARRERTLGLAVAGHDGELAARLPGRLYGVELTCPAHTQPFSTLDREAYKLVPYASFHAPEIDAARISLIDGDSRRLRIYAVPRRHFYTCQYVVIFVTTILWWTVYTPQVVTFQFNDRLPFAPAFAFTALQARGLNDDAVGHWVATTKSFETSRRIDRAQEISGGLISKKVYLRVDGLWAIRKTALRAGDLAAKIEIEYPDETQVLYVYRRVDEPADGLLDWGPLTISDGESDGIGIRPFDPIAGPSWTFNRFYQYGPP